MFHRAAWLVRDTHATGSGRTWREIGATALDPITGVNRFIRGDASRVTEKPADMVPSDLDASGAAGVLWRGTQDSAFTADPQAYLEVDAVYGDPEKGRSRTPYDAFAVRLRFGGGSSLSEARVRGRIARTTFEERQDPVQRPAKLRLPEKRRLRHRLPIVRWRIRVHKEHVVHDRGFWYWAGAA
jgi:hypothetical protein